VEKTTKIGGNLEILSLLQLSILAYVSLHQRGPTGSPRPFVIRQEKVFVNLLLVSTNPFIFFTLKDLKT
jgi:hypothetical protein